MGLLSRVRSAFTGPETRASVSFSAGATFEPKRQAPMGVTTFEAPVKAKRAVGAGIGAFYTGATMYGGGFLMAMRSKDEEIRRDALALRANSRRLANNNPFMRHYLRLLGNNVVGPNGVTMQSLFKSKNKGVLRDPYVTKIEAAWQEWCKPGNCDMSGRYSFQDVCRLFVRTLALDGEVFIRIVRGAPNKFGFSLAFLDADLLDHTYSRAGSPGINPIVMGIEMDTYGKPVAYHFTDPKLIRNGMVGGWAYGAKIIIPADQIIHGLDPDRAIQSRGVPACASVMYILSMLGHYWEAEVACARHESERPGILKSPNGAIDEHGDDDDRLERNALVDPIMAAQNLGGNSTGIAYMGIPAGIEVEFPDVKHPSTAFEAFSKSMLKGIASGLGVAYHELAGDLTSVSFSSIRQGTISQHESFQEQQIRLIQTLCDRAHAEFMLGAWLSGVLKLPAGVTLEQFSAHQFHPRGWDWVDPRADSAADLESIAGAVNTRTKVLAKKGLDWEDVAYELKDEQDLIDALNLRVGPLIQAPAPAGKNDGETEGEPGVNNDGEDTNPPKEGTDGK